MRLARLPTTRRRNPNPPPQSLENGGNTNQENLCCLCAFHNAVNDDERLHGKFGYMTRIDGKLQWVPPTTGHVDANAEARLAQDRLTEVPAT